MRTKAEAEPTARRSASPVGTVQEARPFSRSMKSLVNEYSSSSTTERKQFSPSMQFGYEIGFRSGVLGMRVCG